jgi:hypothetical protein
MAKQLAEGDTASGPQGRTPIERAQPHNTINRQTGTTGDRPVCALRHAANLVSPGMLFDVVVALDEPASEPGRT